MLFFGPSIPDHSAHLVLVRRLQFARRFLPGWIIRAQLTPRGLRPRPPSPRIRLQRHLPLRPEHHRLRAPLHGLTSNLLRRLAHQARLRSRCRNRLVPKPHDKNPRPRHSTHLLRPVPLRSHPRHHEGRQESQDDGHQRRVHPAPHEPEAKRPSCQQRPALRAHAHAPSVHQRLRAELRLRRPQEIRRERPRGQGKGF